MCPNPQLLQNWSKTIVLQNSTLLKNAQVAWITIPNLMTPQQVQNWRKGLQHKCKTGPKQVHNKPQRIPKLVRHDSRTVPKRLENESDMTPQLVHKDSKAKSGPCHLEQKGDISSCVCIGWIRARALQKLSLDQSSANSNKCVPKKNEKLTLRKCARHK